MQRVKERGAHLYKLGIKKNVMIYQPVHSRHGLSESAGGSSVLLWTPLQPAVPFNTSMSENKYIKSNQNSFTHLFCPD